MAFPIARHLSAPFLRWRIASAEGLDFIPRSGPALLVANHVGQQDPHLLIYAILHATGGRAPHTIAKWKIFHNALSQRWLRAIPLYNERHRSFEVAESLLSRGEMVLIFPEGGVNSITTIGRVKTGAARLALATHAPVIPIGMQRITAVPKKELDHLLDIFTARNNIKIGEPIDLSSWYGHAVDRPLIDKVTSVIMSRVSELAGKNYVG